jgi:dTDP-4-dehydrorhamnose 3,5-epimerase
MEVIKTPIEGLLVIKPDVFEDPRGYFFESYSRQRFHDAGLKMEFVQDNESCSTKNVLRGLHFQNPPFAQGKLVRVVSGKVLDVAVDIRKGSPTYGKWHAVELSGTNRLLYWIPAGFAHGFLTLEENTIFQYKCTNVYDKASEGSILWSDPDLNIEWGISNPLVSGKDLGAPLFKDLVTKF